MLKAKKKLDDCKKKPTPTKPPKPTEKPTEPTEPGPPGPTTTPPEFTIPKECMEKIVGAIQDQILAAAAKAIETYHMEKTCPAMDPMPTEPPPPEKRWWQMLAR